MIEALHGKSISQYSSFKNEILLTPGTKLRAESNTLRYRGLDMVQLQQVSDDEQQSSK
jgi:hypothetical protein